MSAPDPLLHYKQLRDPMPADYVVTIRQSILRGLTQVQLAELLGVTSQTVSRWERGETQCTGIHARVLFLLANAEDLGPFVYDGRTTIYDLFKRIARWPTP